MDPVISGLSIFSFYHLVDLVISNIDVGLTDLAQNGVRIKYLRLIKAAFLLRSSSTVQRVASLVTS